MTLKLVQEGRLAMTFALSQALKLLQMPQLELAQELLQEIEKNPLLRESSTAKSFSTSEEVQAPLSLHDHLMHQIREHFPKSIDQRIAKACLFNLDEKGFLSFSLEDLSSQLMVGQDQIQSILEILQTFDPPGIFAKNLQESLLLQLKAQGKTDTPAYLLVKNHFDDLIHQRFSKIQKKMGRTDIDLAIQKLSRLRFRPSEVFERQVTALVLPDIKILPTVSGWTIALHEEDLPRLEICSEYEGVIPKNADEKEQLRSWFTSAKWLMRSLKRRRQILLKIGAFLSQMQKPYLSLQGDLRPLSLQDLASHLHLHELTLSRALSNKYADTPRGIIPLRSLVNLSPEKTKAKETLCQLIAQEEKNDPLSDEQLAKLLTAAGFPLARRTVAKYRHELNIKGCAHRR